MEAEQVKKKSGVADALSQIDEAIREQEVAIDQLRDIVQVVSAGPEHEDKQPINDPGTEARCDIEDYLYNILHNVQRNTISLAHIIRRLRI